MSVVKPEPKLLPKLITTDAKDAKQIHVTGAKRGKTRTKKKIVCLGFTYNWLRSHEKWHEL